MIRLLCSGGLIVPAFRILPLPCSRHAGGTPESFPLPASFPAFIFPEGEKGDRRLAPSAIAQGLHLFPIQAEGFEIFVEVRRVVRPFFPTARHAEKTAPGFRACVVLAAYPQDVFELGPVKEVELFRLLRRHEPQQEPAFLPDRGNLGPRRSVPHGAQPGDFLRVWRSSS